MSISGTASLPTGINETGWVGECDNGYFWSGVGDSNPAPTDNLQTFSFLQNKNHGLQDGMKVQVSGITSTVSVSASSPASPPGGALSGAWQADQSHTNVNPTATSGSGN